MEKLCIFCGKKAISKNMEHVIPQWLIKLTGDPARIAHFGIELLSEPIKERKYSYISFQFPACSACNSKYSELEGKIKNILEKIFNNEIIHEIEICLLLDWFDKIRVGLWLGYRYLDKNACYIYPHFYIDSRIQNRDRFIHIYKNKFLNTGLTFIGASTPLFQYMPSVFALRINQFIFLNASNHSLLARRLGYPYCKSSITREDEKLKVEYERAREYIMQPIIKKRIPYSFDSIGLYQAIYKEELKNQKLKVLYENKYVTNNSLNYLEGLGSIYKVEKNTTKKYVDSAISVSELSMDTSIMLAKINNFIMEYQEYLFEEGVKYNEFSASKKDRVQHTIIQMKQFIRIISKKLVEETSDEKDI